MFDRFITLFYGGLLIVTIQGVFSLIDNDSKVLDYYPS